MLVGLMATTATRRVFAFGSAVTVWFVTSWVGGDAAAVGDLAAAAFVRVSLATAVTAAVADDGRLALSLVAAFPRVFDVAIRIVVLAAAWTWLTRTWGPFHWVTFARRPRSTLATAWRPTAVFNAVKMLLFVTNQIPQLRLLAIARVSTYCLKKSV